MNKVFISYSHEDEKKVTELYNRIVHSEIDIFFDKEFIAWGEKWVIELEQGLKECTHIIVCLSQAYCESEWCKIEQTRFRGDKKNALVGKIFPLLIEDCGELIPDFITQFQMIDISTDGKFDENYKQICEVLGIKPMDKIKIDKTKLPSVKKRLPGPSSLPPKSLNDKFIGRVKSLWDIYETLHESENGQNVCVITGMGGVGKTRLAIEYANRLGNKYLGGIFWIDAEMGYFDILHQMKQSGNDNICSIDSKLSMNDQIKQLWNILGQRKSVLIIYDNFPTYESTDKELKKVNVNPWLPSPSNIYTIITTRRLDIIGKNLPKVDVGVMSESEGIALLNSGDRKFENEEADDAKTLFNRLDGLTIALEVACGYLNYHSNIKIIELIKSIEEFGEMVVYEECEKDYQSDLGYNKNVTGLFKVSYNAIIDNKSDEVIKDVLHCISLLAPYTVPTSVLQNSIEVERATIIGHPINKSIITLGKDLSLVELDEENDPKMHRLIIAYVKSRFTEERSSYITLLQKLTKGIISVISSAVEKSDLKACKIMEKVIPHAEKIVLNKDLDKKLVGTIYYNLGKIYEILGRKDKAVSSLEKAVQNADERGEITDKARALAYLNISQFHAGNFDKSEEAVNQALTIFHDNEDKLNKEDSEAYAVTLDWTGENHRNKWKMEESLDFHKRAIEAAEKAGNKRIQAHATANIGAVYMWQKNLRAVIPEWEKALSLSSEIDDHPWIAHYTIDIGLIKLLIGEYDSAMEYFSKGINLANEGKFEDNIARGKMNKASVQFIQNELEKSEKNYIEALEVAKKAKVARLVWRIEHNIGNVYLKKNGIKKDSQAEKHYIRAVDYLMKMSKGYKTEEDKSGFFKHRLNPFKALINLYLELDDINLAVKYVKLINQKMLNEYFERRKNRIDLESEEKNANNFNFINGYYIETE